MGRNLGKPLGPQLARLLEAYAVNNLDELADAMGLPYPTVRNWHARDSVPEKHVRRASDETGFAVKWIDEGIEPKMRSDLLGATHIVPNERKRTPPNLVAVPGGEQRKIGSPPRELPEAVLAAVLRALEARNLTLPPDKLASLVTLICEHVTAQLQLQGDGDDGASEVDRTTERFLRLVA